MSSNCPTYIINGQIVNPFTGNEIIAEKLEIWLKHNTYDELIEEPEVLEEGKFYAAFSTESSESTPPSLYFKATINSQVVACSLDFEPTTLENTLDFMPSEGENEIIIYPIDATTYETNDSNEEEPVKKLAARIKKTGEELFYNGINVQLNLKYNNLVIENLGSHLTNSTGLIGFYLPKNDKVHYYNENHEDSLSLEFNFTDQEEQDLGTKSEAITGSLFDIVQTILVEVDLAVTEPITTKPISEVLSEFSISISTGLSDYFTNNDISTLEDIRMRGTLSVISDLADSQYDADRPSMNLLDSHARLELVSGNYDLNHFIIDTKGYDSIVKIAKKPRWEFVKEVIEHLGTNEFMAARIHHVSRHFADRFKEKFHDFATNGRGQLLNTNSDDGDDSNNDIDDRLRDLIDEKCSCNDCDAAVSPFAYLADLLEYSGQSILGTFGDRNVTAIQLQSWFCQPFTCLTKECDELENTLCQYRIAIEALNCYKTSLDPTQCQLDRLEEKTREYLVTAYYILLNQFGTSYEEIRANRNAITEKQEKVSSKLGIPLDYESINTIGELSLDPKALPLPGVEPQNQPPKVITHYKLETLFGLRSAEYSAAQECATSVNGEITGVNDPAILNWKLEHLNQIWLEQDAEELELGNSKPIIDPDILTAGDFVAPVKTVEFSPAPGSLVYENPAYEIWEKRKEWINSIYNDFNLPEHQFPVGTDLGLRKITFETTYLPDLKAFDRVSLTEIPDHVFTIKTVNTTSAGTPTVYTTELQVFEGIPPFGSNGTGTSSEFKFEKTLGIPSVSVLASTSEISISSLPSSIIAGSKIIIENSSEDDGVYEVSSIDPPNNTFEVSGQLNGDFSDARVRYTEIITSATIDRSNIKLILNEVETTDFRSPPFDVQLSNTERSDGTYSITAVGINTDTNLVELTIDETKHYLPQEEAAGTISFEKYIDSSLPPLPLVNVTNIHPGKRAIILDSSDNDLKELLDEIGSQNDTIEIIESSASDNNKAYNLNTVEIVNNQTIIKVDEIIPVNVSSGKIQLSFNITVAIPNNSEVTVPQYNLENILASKNSLNFGGDNYSFVSATFNGSDTIITLSDPPTPDPVNDKLLLTFDISDLDLSNQFLTVDANLKGELFKGDSFEIRDNNPADPSDPGLNREYTIESISYSQSTEIYVKEIFQTTDKTGAVLAFDKKIELSQKKPKTAKIYEYITDNGIDYNGLSTVNLSWDLSHAAFPNDSHEDFQTVYENLENGIDVETNQDAVKTGLHLSADAFKRMVELEIKINGNAESEEPLTEAEIQEWYNILILSLKSNEGLTSNWLLEENDENIDLSYKFFWKSLYDYKEGNIRLNYNWGTPLIDPQLIKQEKTQDTNINKTSKELWNQRADQLQNIKSSFEEIYNAKGLHFLIERVLLNLLDQENIHQQMSQLAAGLLSIDQSEIAESEHIIEEYLFMRVEDFNTLMILKFKYDNPSETLSSEDQDAVLGLLLNVYKKKYLYTQWIEEEVDSPINVVDPSDPANVVQIPSTYYTGSGELNSYWYALKAELPVWRASIGQRNAWQNALETYNRIPIIDPDLLRAIDFKDQNSNEKDIYTNRTTALSDEWTTISNITGTDDEEKIENIIVAYLNLDSIEAFEFLKTQEEAGVSIKGRLEQLHLTFSSYRRLLELKETAGVSSADDLLQHEWEEVYSIALQTWKIREQYAIWNIEEKNEGISLSPDAFQLRAYYSDFPVDEDDALPEWRAFYRDRRNWEKTLQSRIDQRATVRESVDNAIREAEEKVLPLMRDALVQAAGEFDKPLHENAKNLSDRLLIDFQTTCCQETTRLSSAIITLQKLLITLRDRGSISLGLLTDFENVITLDDNRFEAKWQWLGSYATWRSAMFVYLYPENLLLPQLKRKQTPVFKEIVNEITESGRVSLPDICKYQRQYDQYMRDISYMEMLGSITENTAFPSDDPFNSSCSSQSGDLIPTLHMFGRSIDTKKFYWCYRNLYVNPNYSLSQDNPPTHWQELKAFGSNRIHRFVGVREIRIDSKVTTHIAIFVVQKKMDKKILSYAKMNIHTLEWDSELTELEFEDEEDVVFNSITVNQVFSDTQNFISKHWLGRNCTFAYIDSDKKLNTVMLSGSGTNLVWPRNYLDDITSRPGQSSWYYYASIYKVIDILSYVSLGNNSIAIIYTYYYSNRPYQERTGILVDTYYSDIDEFRIFAFEGDPQINKDNYRGVAPFLESNNSTGASSFSIFYKQGNNVREEIIEVDKKANYSLDVTSYIGLTNRTIYNQNIANSRLDKISFNSIGLNTYSYHSSSGLKKQILGAFYDDSEKTYTGRRSILLRIKPISGIFGIPGTIFNDVHDYMSLSPIFSNTELKVRVDINNYGIRKDKIDNTIALNSQSYVPEIMFDYIEEAAYFLPIFFAQQLCNNGYHQEALKWYKTLYNYSEYTFLQDKWIYEGLQLDAGDGNPNDNDFERVVANNTEHWLLDPLNPHAIARGRENNYLKYTLKSIANCLIAWADAEYTVDTVESVSQASELYQTAIEILNHEVFNYYPEVCEYFAKQKAEETYCDVPVPTTPVGSDPNGTSGNSMMRLMLNLFNTAGERIKTQSAVRSTIEELAVILKTGADNPSTYNFDIQLALAYDHLDSTVAAQEVGNLTLGAYLNDKTSLERQTSDLLLAKSQSDKGLKVLKSIVEKDFAQAVSEVTGVEQAELVDPTQSFLFFQQDKQERQNAAEQVALKHNEGSEMQPESADLQFYRILQEPDSAIEELEEFVHPFVPSLGVPFCVPENPVFNTLRMKAELNLFKIRNCMNIAGMKRQLDPYAAPTDTTSGLPSIGPGGQISLPGSVKFSPTQYRYEIIIERAKQLVTIAQQVEGNFLAALEKRDAEAYTMMKAKQDLRLANSSVKLQDLRINVAKGEVDLANLQKERSELQVEGLQEMINQGLLDIEQELIGLYYTSAALSTTASIGQLMVDMAKTGGSTPISEALKTALGGAGGAIKLAADISNHFVRAGISAKSLKASQARREQEWNFQLTLANQDVKIGSQQVKIAQDQVRVVTQEKRIAEFNVRHAEDSITFLNTKFTNTELYSWMSGVLENAYAYFLQQATAMAKMATQQLAFERQTAPPPFIQDDYWETPSSGALQLQPAGTESDRRGLTGSVRLLQDITKIDQYAFQTDKRKLELSKTISLSTYAPIEFQQFKKSGELTFETLMEYFDRDFPGHYMRTIKQVRVNVIALVSPVDGIKATLTSAGVSRVVVKGDTFQEITINRLPEEIALTGNEAERGVYAMQPEDNKFLRPFEGSGVAGRWLFSMPLSSNLINYDSIADILVTIDYTAFSDRDYRQQLLRKMDPSFSGERTFVFTEELADQWYELKHPEESSTPMEIEIDITRFDFPANLSYLSIEDFKILYVINKEKDNPGYDKNLLKSNLEFTLQDGTNIKGDVNPNDEGILGISLGNAASLISMISSSPVGKLKIKYDNNTSTKILFEEDVIENIVLVISFNGDLQLALNS